MSSPFTLSVGDVEVIYGQSYVDSELSLPFQPTDLRRRARTVEEGDFIGLEAPGFLVGRRLDLLGYTITGAVGAYVEGLARGKEQFPRYPWPNDLRAWQRTVFDQAKRIREWELRRPPTGDFEWDESYFNAPEHEQSFVWEEALLGFPGGNLWHVVRALVDASDPNVLVTFDLTDLVTGGYVREDGADLWVADARAPVVVLTEGKSDARLLRLALDTLWPEYADFIRFLDYDFARAAGGTGEVVRFVRMFAGSGIKNRVVALFDNDTAGHQALQELGQLPPHVFGMCLPPLPAFREFPSLGPDGEGVSDVDGRACSLELYLGREALTGADGRLRPVRWTGFNEKLRRYQGEISCKAEVQESFEGILSHVRANPTDRAKYDFAGIEAVFEAMLKALAAR